MSVPLLALCLFIFFWVFGFDVVSSDDESKDEVEIVERGYLQSCPDNTTICNPAEMLHCIDNICNCANGTVWEQDYHTCRPLEHEPYNTWTPMKIALVVGFSVAVLVLVAVFVIRKRLKETTFKPTLEERRRSTFQAAHGDIPMKQRKFSQHFA